MRELLLTVEVTDPATYETVEFDFTITDEKYKKFRQSMQGKDKIAPVSNFVAACADKEKKSELVAMFRAEEGLADKIAEPLLDEWLSKKEITVKKRKPSLSTSSQTAT